VQVSQEITIVGTNTLAPTVTLANGDRHRVRSSLIRLHAERNPLLLRWQVIPETSDNEIVLPQELPPRAQEAQGGVLYEAI
jgi:hypothetical protein